MKKEQIHIRLPKTIEITPELLERFSNLNKRIAFKKESKHILVLEEFKFKFEDYEYLTLKFPSKLFKNNNFDTLYTLNANRFNFEQPGNNTINIKMGTFDIIGIITMAIGGALYLWTTRTNKGLVRSENTEYQFKNEEGELKRYMADVSYIDFDKAPEDVQLKWKKRSPVAPTLAIEILSSKKPIELKRNLTKMQQVWIKNGTDIGIVIDSFGKKYYVFENGKPEFVAEEIHKPFTHELLPGYTGNFGIHADKL